MNLKSPKISYFMKSCNSSNKAEKQMLEAETIRDRIVNHWKRVVTCVYRD